MIDQRLDCPSPSSSRVSVTSSLIPIFKANGHRYQIKMRMVPVGRIRQHFGQRDLEQLSINFFNFAHLKFSTLWIRTSR